MSPRRRTAKARIWASVVGVVLAGAMLWVAVVWVSNGNGKGQLAPTGEFSVGSTKRLAAEIVDRGPFLFPDASPEHRRDIYVQHLGRDLDVGWWVLGALAPGQTDRECFIVWTGDEFRDPCTKKLYPAKGDGLTKYANRVADGTLYVDLSAKP
jgi:hypothetical protein